MSFFFDEEADVLDITFGEPEKAVVKELKDDMAVRVDPEAGGDHRHRYTEFHEKIQGKEEDREGRTTSQSEQ